MIRLLTVLSGMLLACASAVLAGPEKVAFRPTYKRDVLYATVDRPDNRTVRDLYASRDAVNAAKRGARFPSGAVFTMEVYKAKLDETGQPVKDAAGRLVRTGELVGIFVMEKRTGWGAEYPADIRNGEWEYARFTVDGQRQPNLDTKPCFQCHKSISGQDFVFSLSKLVEKAR